MKGKQMTRSHFEKPSFHSIGDRYLGPYKRKLLLEKKAAKITYKGKRHKPMKHELVGKFGGNLQRPVKSAYPHMRDTDHKYKKKKLDDQGNVAM